MVTPCTKHCNDATISQLWAVLTTMRQGSGLINSFNLGRRPSYKGINNPPNFKINCITPYLMHCWHFFFIIIWQKDVSETNLPYWIWSLKYQVISKIILNPIKFIKKWNFYNFIFYSYFVAQPSLCNLALVLTLQLSLRPF